MQRTYVYLPDELKREIDNTAKAKRVSKSEVIREAVEQGLKVVRPQKSQSAKALLEMAKKAEKLNVSGPADLAEKHNEYTWD